ncbi:MAG: DUF58 domain-containing protein [Flavobacteriia bacterium]|nr:DUF58 domain-containing protein [Flavobacteriia bacterium]
MSDKIKLEEIIPYGNLEFLAKEVVEGFITGLHKSPFHGFSVEFAEHRIYNKGESTRHIDWKLYARTDKLFTKKYEEETNLRCQILIDCSSSMYFKGKNDLNKIQYSVFSAVSLIELLKKQRDAVGISLFSDHLFQHTPAKSSPAHLRYLYSELEKFLLQYSPNNTQKSNIVQALHDVAELCHRRSLILVFTDLLDEPEKQAEFFRALQHVKHNKHEVVVFHVLDSDAELDFEFDNRPYQLIDMETGEKIKLNPSQIKEKYKSQIEEYFSKIQLTCLQYKIDYVFCPIKKGYYSVLLEYLIKRQKMIVKR